MIYVYKTLRIHMFIYIYIVVVVSKVIVVRVNY